MRSLGVVRYIDSLGRVVLPKEIRNRLGWDESTPIEFWFNSDDSVTLRAYNPTGDVQGGLSRLRTQLVDGYLDDDHRRRALELVGQIEKIIKEDDFYAQ